MFHGRARSSGGEIMERDEEEFWGVGSQVFLEVSFFNFFKLSSLRFNFISFSNHYSTDMASNLVEYLRLLHQLRNCSLS